MAHLSCKEHKRRVVVLEHGPTIHRNGDGSRCTSDQPLILDGEEISIYEIDGILLHRRLTTGAERLGKGLKKIGVKAQEAADALAKAFGSPVQS